MSNIYDNWGKLVAAVVKKEQLWQLFHEQSRSPSLSSESSGFSFNLGSIDDVDFSCGPIFGDFASNSKGESSIKQIDVAGSSSSETGEMCAMKEVILSTDDAESKKSVKQLEQEITLLSSLRHPNIVQYYGSEMLDEKFYIYSEYISGGTVSKILKEYGRLGESAIRSYTRQILSGLAYLNSKSTVHRDIKGATILVDPNGSVKLASFGTAKHTIELSDRLFEGLPYWMAPEVIRNFRECSPAVDIWSVGCTILEMATAEPPWSQYKAAMAMFKIGYSTELPTIPDYLSGEGKEFVRLCLQRNPLYRPTAAQLLKHPFMKGSFSPIEKQKLGSTSSYPPALAATSTVNSLVISHARNLQHLDSERLTIHSSRVLSKPNINSIDIYTPRNISRTVSPVAVAAQTPSFPQRGVSPVPLPIPHPPSPPERLDVQIESPQLHWYEI